MELSRGVCTNDSRSIFHIQKVVAGWLAVCSLLIFWELLALKSWEIYGVPVFYARINSKSTPKADFL